MASLLFIEVVEKRQKTLCTASYFISSSTCSTNSMIHMHSVRPSSIRRYQGSHRLEKYLDLEGLHEKSLKIKYALKNYGKSLKCLEKSLNSSIFCRT